jgi:hypothetical protein
VCDYSRDLRPAKWGSGVSLHDSHSESLMSALGHKRTIGASPHQVRFTPVTGPLPARGSRSLQKAVNAGAIHRGDAALGGRYDGRYCCSHTWIDIDDDHPARTVMYGAVHGDQFAALPTR